MSSHSYKRKEKKGYPSTNTISQSIIKLWHTLMKGLLFLVGKYIVIVCLLLLCTVSSICHDIPGSTMMLPATWTFTGFQLMSSIVKWSLNHLGLPTSRYWLLCRWWPNIWQFSATDSVKMVGQITFQCECQHLPSPVLIQCPPHGLLQYWLLWYCLPRAHYEGKEL